MTVVFGSRRQSPPHADDTLRLPLVLPGPSETASPVFVDATGRRARRMRRWGLIVAVPAAGYLVAVVSSLFGGPSLPSALLLIDEPSHGSTPHDDGTTATADELASAPTAPREAQESVIRSGPTADTAPGQMAPRRSDGEASRSQTQPRGQSMGQGKSGETPGAERRNAQGQPAWAGRPSAGNKQGDPRGRHVANGQRDAQPSAATHPRSADSG